MKGSKKEGRKEGRKEGMAEKAGEEGAGAPGGVRGSLVTSLAANIFDTLKSNDDIALILTGVLDPARDDKEDLMKHLMSTINTTLQVGGMVLVTDM